MKKGLIVYLTDSNTLPMSFDADEALTSLSLSCDHSVLAARAITQYWPLQQKASMTFLRPGI
jgi:hypothetical protein